MIRPTPISTRTDTLCPYTTLVRSSRERDCSRAKTRRARQRRKGGDMTMTRDFKETVKERAGRDPAFAKALLDEAATLFLNGEPHTARLILRDLVNASLGFETLAVETRRPSKSLHRMLSEKGNPSMDNLAAIFGAVRKKLGVSIKAEAVSAG